MLREAATFLRSAFAIVILVAIAGAAHSEDDHSSLAIYAVTVNRTPIQTWGLGNGVYLGRGLVLTAAHVVGRTFWTRPKVVVAGRELTTETIKEGRFEGVDLTLLRVDQDKLPIALALRMNPICHNDPRVGMAVATAVPNKVALTRILSPSILPPNALRFRTLIGDFATTGMSGSAVFDVQRKCLLGIVSRKISVTVPGTKETRDIAKYFVPAAEIRDFIPAEYRF